MPFSFLSSAPDPFVHYHTFVEPDEELEHYGRENCADECPCHPDLLLRMLRHILRLTDDAEVIQAELGK